MASDSGGSVSGPGDEEERLAESKFPFAESKFPLVESTFPSAVNNIGNAALIHHGAAAADAFPPMGTVDGLGVIDTGTAVTERLGGSRGEEGPLDGFSVAAVTWRFALKGTGYTQFQYFRVLVFGVSM